MSYLVRLVEKKTLSCGCVISRYRGRKPPHKEEVYVDKKGDQCTNDDHQYNRKF